MAHLYKAIFKKYHHPMTNLLKQYIPKDGTVIDVGGHAGQFTKIFSKIVPEGRVYTFEPGDYAWSILQKTNLFQGWKNVHLIKKGVGAACGIKIFRVPIKKSGSIGFGISHVMPKSIEPGKESYITQQIEITTLDEFVCEHPLSRLDFIKIDIEGYEWEAFQGMRNTLEKFQPVVMAELDTNLLKRFNADKKQVLALFADMNYEDFFLDEKNGTLEKNRDYPNGDYFFIPRHKIKG